MGAPPTGETWYWQGTNANGTSTALGSGTTYIATTSGTYYIRARNSSGCWSSASGSVAIVVGTTPNPPSNPSSNSPQCSSVTITRSGIPSIEETWYWQGTNANGTSTALGSGTTYIASTSGTYYIRAQNSSGCWSSRSGSVTVSTSSLGAPSSFTGTSLCQPGYSTIYATSSGSGNTIRWYNSATGGIPIYMGSSYSSYFSTSTTYYAANYNSLNSCESSNRTAVTVTVSSLTPPNNITITTCADLPTSIQLNPVTGGNTLRWYSFSSGGSPFFTGLTYSASFSSSSTLYVSSYNSAFQCESTRTPISINVKTNPIITYSVTNSNFNQNGSFIGNIVAGSPPYYFDWDFDGKGDFNDILNQSNLAPGDYQLTIKDGNNCIAIYKIKIDSDNEILIATGISPNNDNNNDKWQILGTDNLYDLKVSVFDVNGIIIHYQENKYIPWDGTFNNQLVPIGEYYFLIESVKNKKRYTGILSVRY